MFTEYVDEMDIGEKREMKSAKTAALVNNASAVRFRNWKASAIIMRIIQAKIRETLNLHIKKFELSWRRIEAG